MPVDIGATILQVAQLINSNAQRTRQLDMQERELKLQEQRATQAIQMEDRRLAATQKAQEAEAQYSKVRAALQESEARLNLLKLGDAEREKAAAARFNDPSILDDRERASAQKYAGFSTITSLHDRVSELTRANTQLPPSDPAYIKNRDDITEALAEIRYRGAYIGNAVGAARLQGGEEQAPNLQSAQRQADQAVKVVNDAVGAPKPGTPPAGVVGATSTAYTPLKDLVAEGTRIVDAYRAGQISQFIAYTELQKVIGRTGPHQSGAQWNQTKALFAGMVNSIKQ